MINEINFRSSHTGKENPSLIRFKSSFVHKYTKRDTAVFITIINLF